MATPYQNLKNFIRHGKQARIQDAHSHPAPPQQHYPHIDPTIDPPDHLHAQQGQRQDYSVAPGADDNCNVAAANAAGVRQNHPVDSGVVTGGGHGGISAGGIGAHGGKTYDENLLAKIVAEERESRERLPRYPGLERWALKEKMGDGAFSNVYRARDTREEYGEVAIKVVRKYELNTSQNDNHLHPDFKKVPKTVERSNILKEVQIMRGLNHPNIVSLISFSESRSYYYLVLELCPGGELFHQIVRLTYFSENLGRHVIVQVAEALRYLHQEKGVVHRDIKPENLLFDPIPFIPTKNPKPRGPEDEDKADEGEFLPGIGAGGIGRIKVADFGLSKVVWDSQTMTPCGTVGYTAPEIIKDERYSRGVDMWAMGCVLYTLLCGFPPFYDESISVLTEKVAKGQYTFLSPWWDNISKSAQDLVSHLLTVDPEKRYTIHEFMAHPWVRGTDEETTAALDAPPLATPAIRSANKAFAPMVVEPDFSPDVGVPGAAKRMDFRSPGVVSLREVFDVGYAVHRMEEEGKRRKNWKQGYRGGPQPLNEEDEFDSEDDEVGEPVKIAKESDADDVAGMEQTLRQTDLNAGSTYAGSVAAARGTGVSGLAKQHQAGGGTGQAAAPSPGRTRKKHGGPFELSLDNATLLGRRKRQDQPVEV
ncbi:unnamed protein product [Tuber aestivum]|uniref:Protein kinase domain-containing protein n=1 Tax=Tuber aestivum TaxID=59557 RepID=A0A292Q412_9PEZI|nr:unnamed protein product [Tuber aestivum]